jgi:hypothetical protein
LSEDHGRFLADGRLVPATHGLSVLRRCCVPMVYLTNSEALPLANFRTPNPGRSSSKAWMSLAPSGTCRADFLVSEFGHDGLPIAERKSTFRCAEICRCVLGKSARRAKKTTVISKAYAAFCRLLHTPANCL